MITDQLHCIIKTRKFWQKLWYPKGAPGLDHMSWDQVSRGHFGHVYLCCKLLENLKKLVCPNMYAVKKSIGVALLTET